MTSTLLPELAAESVATAERLVRLSAEEGLDSVEADYILASGIAAIQRLPKLWPIIKGRIGRGTTGAAAKEVLERLLYALDKNLALAETLKEPARVDRGQTGLNAEAATGLAEAEKQLLEIRAEAERLLRIVDAPARWPDDEKLRQARERMQAGDCLTADEFRKSLLQ